MTPSTGDRKRHERLARRVDAYVCDLLSEPEREEFERHVTECSECRAAVETTREELADEEAPGHLPSNLLARWPQARAQLRGLERALVRSHLESCEDCRRVLLLLGHEPVLEVNPALEPSASALEAIASAAPAEGSARAPERTGTPREAQSAGPIVEASIQRWRRRNRWIAWSGWMAAAAAAGFIVVSEIGKGTGGGGVDVTYDLGTGDIEASKSLKEVIRTELGESFTVFPISQPMITKGTPTTAEQAIPIGNGRNPFLVRVPYPSTGAESLRVELRASDGTLVGHGDVASHELKRRQALSLWGGSRAIEQGMYRVLLIPIDPTGAERDTTVVAIRLTP